MNKKILIAEDEGMLREPLKMKLLKEGFEVLEAKNGQEALTMCLESHPDLLLLDIVMPKMDGMETLKALRNDEWAKTLPVIILTNSSSMEKIAEAAEYNAKEYLIKSDVQLHQIVEKVKSLLA